MAVMLRLLVLLGACACAAAAAAPRTDDQPAPNLNSVYFTAQAIESHGYSAETHHVTTSDGYILEMHRIPYSRHETQAAENRPVAFLMHGLLSASNAFIALGPESSISYNLADAGVDVWMGNARGSKNSRRHVSLDPDDDVQKMQFFDFTWEEIGMYDVAAMVDYILDYTGKERLHYIGHSQGGTVFLVLNSMRPEYNARFASAHLLAGVGYMRHFPDADLTSTAQLTDFIYSMSLMMGMIEVFPPNSTDVDVGEPSASSSQLDYCLGDVRLRQVCDVIGLRQVRLNIDDILSGSGSDEMGGGSLKQIAHYGQNIRDQLFRRYHHGADQNLELYGSSDPPLYDLSLITVNTTMHYTVSDNLLDERDVLAMVADMPNTVARRVARDSFLHEDFAAAADVKELVTDWMIEAIYYVEANMDSDDNDNDGGDDNDNDGGDDNDDDGGDDNDDDGDEDDNASGEVTDPVPGSASNAASSFILKMFVAIYSFLYLKQNI